MGGGPSPSKLYYLLGYLASSALIHSGRENTVETGEGSRSSVLGITPDQEMMHRDICGGFLPRSEGTWRGTHTPPRKSPFKSGVSFHTTPHNARQGIADCWGCGSSISTFTSYRKTYRGCHNQCYHRCFRHQLLLPMPSPRACSRGLLPQELNLRRESSSHILLKRGLVLSPASEAQPTGIHHSSFVMK